MKTMIRRRDMTLIVWALVFALLSESWGFRTTYKGEINPINQTYFRPYDPGFIGRYGDPSNYQRERINEGAFSNPTQELLFGDYNGQQICPGMVGPFSDGSFYCTAKEYGYCDVRSGTCMCNTGYQGIDCSECQQTHYLMGGLCFPKMMCPNDCSNMGTCNYNNGTCSCVPFRTGDACEHLLCINYHPHCSSCNKDRCLACIAAHYLTMDSRVCGSCSDFDPRCSACSKQFGCANCSDPLLTSVRRSGYRNIDAKLPFEENTRQISFDIPFGSKTPEIFNEAEPYVVVDDPTLLPLKAHSTTCSQGLQRDESWLCSPFPASHVVCGSKGVFQFTYPNYVVSENCIDLRLSVRRTGGGYGNVSVDYFVRHISTNDSDLVPTQHYTSSQTLWFYPGIVEKTFLVRIIDDNLVEGDEVFQVYLGTPTGGAHLGPQYRTYVTIIDNDLSQINAKFTRPVGGDNTIKATAGVPYSSTIQGATSDGGGIINHGGERFICAIERYNSNASAVEGEDIPLWGESQRTAERTRCNVTDKGNGQYNMRAVLIEQGIFPQRIWHAFSGGLMGRYYTDAYFQTPTLDRIDYVVNFTWAQGRITTNGANYVSVRWTGAVLSTVAGYYSFRVDSDAMVRLWVEGDLLLDHLTQQRGYMEPSRQVHFEADSLYEVELEYVETAGAGGVSYVDGGHAFVRLMWSISSEASGVYRWGGRGGLGDVSPMDVIPMSSLYSLHEIDMSPLIVTVSSAATDAGSTECFGDGLTRAETSVTSYFTCCPRDRYGNLRDDDDPLYLSTQRLLSTMHLTSSLGLGGLGAELLRLTPTYDHQSHCFHFDYTPQRGGRYELNITHRINYDDHPDHVYGSPFSFIVPAKSQTYGPAATISDPLIGGMNPAQLLLPAGTCYNFTIIARDSSGTKRGQGGDRFEVGGADVP